ncbi:MAG: hypothetical protein MK171_13270 [Pirellulales bacterium]|nr:hypothetical protein [Pirellulales bacterium]
MTTELPKPEYDSDANLDEEFEYRPLSMGAMAAAGLGLLSLLVFAAARISLSSSLMLAPIPLVGLVTGILALHKIRSMPDQLTGSGPALTGIVLSIASLAGGLGYAGFVHVTEVPDGYVRTAFYEFRPDEVDLRGGKVVPPYIQQLANQQVFIKGYMRPGTHTSKNGTPVRHNVSRFRLVRDDNECCFGDLSEVKYYDQILVKMLGNQVTDYSTRIFRLGGKLQVRPENANRADAPVFILEADYVQ